jgi:hypothetical protein
MTAPRSAYGPPAGKHADRPSRARISPQGLFLALARPLQGGAAGGPARPVPRRPLAGIRAPSCSRRFGTVVN